MRKILSRIIHFFIMPCSQATLVMEQERMGKVSLLRKWQLRWHLSLCKLCAVYYDKLNKLEEWLSHEKKEEEKEIFLRDDLQQFKERLKKKIEK